ncbi:MAG: hypothetical protein CVV02_02740 [Firmicutes bacterium HGW-Firmicutes-7]|nr:MAG: hypothetical protein CVV02_02740 [Firmicutes bacterium HGW-Firmicutes-7]
MITNNYFRQEITSVIEEIHKSISIEKLMYSENELLEIIQKALEHNEMAMYLLYELYMSIQ